MVISEAYDNKRRFVIITTTSSGKLAENVRATRIYANMQAKYNGVLNCRDTIAKTKTH